MGGDHRDFDLVEVDLAQRPGGLKDGRRVPAEEDLRRDPDEVSLPYRLIGLGGRGPQKPDGTAWRMFPYMGESALNWL